jgi:hypothetical protein
VARVRAIDQHRSDGALDEHCDYEHAARQVHKREHIMALSKRPAAKKKQLANRRDAPPPPKGNQRARRHGGQAMPDAKRLEQITNELTAAMPIQSPHDKAAIHLCALAIARLESVGTYLNEHGLLFRDGRERPATVLERRLSNEARTLLAELGLTPRARVAIGVALSQVPDVAQALSEPDPTRRRGLMRDAGLVIDATAVDDELDDEEDDER